MSKWLETVVSLFTKTDYVTLISMALSFVLGGLLASQHYEIVMAEEMLAKEKAVQRQIEANLTTERENAERLAETIAERDKALADVDARERTVATLLSELRSASANPMPTTNAGSCLAERKAVARCRSLLAEGAELLAEGSERLERNAVTHDALARLVE